MSEKTQKFQPFIFENKDLELVSYLSIRTKTIFSAVLVEEADQERKCGAFGTFWVETKNGSAEIMIKFHEKEVLFSASDAEGLDPFWDPAGIRLRELRAVVEGFGYKLTLFMDESHSRYEEFFGDQSSK